MSASLRETGSILVRAPRDQVYDLLVRRMAGEPMLRAVPASRLESESPAFGLRTFVLRDEQGGTRVIHARSQPLAASLLQGPPNALRLAVQAELYQLQSLVEARGREA